MKRFVLSIILVTCLLTAANAQRRLDPGMNYIYNPKPNSILYHDTLFSGSKQFQSLFFRNGDMRLINLYDRHQSNKITGQVLATIGILATAVGVTMVSGTGNNKAVGWTLLGGGFACSVTGSYLVLMSQRNLQMAVTLFNSQHHRASAGIGVGEKRGGLLLSF